MIPPGLALAARCQRAGPGSGVEAAPSLPSEALSLIFLEPGGAKGPSPGISPQGWPLGFCSCPFPTPDTAQLGVLGSDCVRMMDGASPECPSLVCRMKGCADGPPGPPVWISGPSCCFPTLTKPRGQAFLGRPPLLQGIVLPQALLGTERVEGPVPLARCISV